MGSIPLVFSETITASKIEIIAPTTARVGEAFDVTLKAVDNNGTVATWYRWSVIFSTENIGDIYPLPGKAIWFTADDNGEKKFSKWVIFKKSGKQKLSVYDLSAEIVWEVTINVSPASEVAPVDSWSIIIVTPDNGTQISGSMITVSGKTRKNSKVIVKLNWQQVWTAEVSDADGVFVKNITDITQESNIVIAQLIDSSNAVLATSPEVKFTHIASSSNIYGVTINPSSTVESSSPIEIVVDATPGLSELTINLDGSILTTKEWVSGKYSIQTVAPQKAWIYKLVLTQKNALGQPKTTDSPTSMTVIDKEVVVPVVVPPTFKNIKTVVTGSRIVFDFWVDNPPIDLHDFKIVYGQNADNLSSEVNTMSLEKIPSTTVASGYTWYIDKIPEWTYTFKIFGRIEDGSLIPDFSSEPIIWTIGKDSCSIWNITDLTVKTDTTKSIISWDALSGAVSYNLYKVSPAGDYTLFQNTTESSYTLYLSAWAIVHDNFVVKALCDNSTESKEYSTMSRVQSGPGMIAIVVVISAIFSAFLMRRRYI